MWIKLAVVADLIIGVKLNLDLPRDGDRQQERRNYENQRGEGLHVEEEAAHRLGCECRDDQAKCKSRKRQLR